MSDKQCALDRILTLLINSQIRLFSAIIASMVNSSFEQGIFHSSYKHAIVRSRIKKPSLDPLDIKSFRLISNLSFISKVVEPLGVNRLSDQISQHKLLPERQSAYRRLVSSLLSRRGTIQQIVQVTLPVHLAYRRHHSTETAVTIVHIHIVRAADFGHVSALVLLDLSAAFDISTTTYLSTY